MIDNRIINYNEKKVSVARRIVFWHYIYTRQEVFR